MDSLYEKLLAFWQRHPRLRTWALNIGKGLVVLGLLAMVSAYGLLKYSERPEFCTTCHYMDPYYAAWKTSSHNKVPCLECHYAPGVREELRSKWEALSQVAKYITGTYGTKPWAEISDRSCLRSGCHDKRLLRGEVVFKNILFDHTEHLTELRRGKRLRCVSCHSQIVQGEHMTVTTSTCFICHFKEQEEGRDLADCNLCHGAPTKRVEFRGVSFDHQEVVRQGVECKKCHEKVTQGDGAVPRDRCFTCHAEPERIAKYDDSMLIHDLHITEHKVECTQCHLEIRHEVTRLVETLALDCQSCHPDHHVTQKELYMGIGGKGVSPAPDPMFLTNVSCKGCHIEHKGSRLEGFTATAPSAACMNCHGTRFGTMLAEWKTQMESRLRQIIPVLEKARGEIRAAASRGVNVREIEPLLSEASHNVDMVRYGKGVHNIRYSEELLRTAVENIETAMSKIGSRYRPPSIFAKAASAESKCLGCHYGAEAKGVSFAGRIFPHHTHTVEQGLACSFCHSPEGPQSPTHGMLVITPKQCSSCHHQQVENCQSCHSMQEAVYRGTTKLVAEPMPDFMAQAGIDCANCHVPEGPPPGRAALPGRAGRSRRSVVRPTNKVCEVCHDVSYNDRMTEWQQTTKNSLDEIRGLYARIRNAKLVEANRDRLDEVDRILTLVERDGTLGVHNSALVGELLTNAKGILEKILTRARTN